MIVYTGGTFDLFHYGHIELLQRCHSYGDVYVSLNTDDFIKQYKGYYPVCTYEERRRVLLGCRFVKDVIPNIGGADSKPAILQVRPRYIIIGSDWAPPKDYYAQMQFTKEWLEEQKIELLFVPYTKGISTSELKRRLCER